MSNVVTHTMNGNYNSLLFYFSGKWITVPFFFLTFCFPKTKKWSISSLFNHFSWFNV